MAEVKVLKQLQSDPELKESGVWLEVYFAHDTGFETVRVKARANDSDKVRSWDAARLRSQRAMWENGNIPPAAVLRKNEIDRLAEVQILDWDLTDEGKPVPCTPEMIREVLKALPDLAPKASAKTQELENYRRARVEALAKNSETPSPSTSGAGAATAV